MLWTTKTILISLDEWDELARHRKEATGDAARRELGIDILRPSDAPWLIAKQRVYGRDREGNLLAEVLVESSRSRRRYRRNLRLVGLARSPSSRTLPLRLSA